MKRSNLLAAAAALVMAVVFCGAAFASQTAARVDVYPGRVDADDPGGCT